MQNENSARFPPVAWLHLGFALTGAGTTLLGCILPALTNLWRMNDGRAGVLFAAQFSGSALGALLVSNDFFRSIRRGYWLLIASALSLTWLTGKFQIVLFFGLGLGLGLTMTATSMLIGSQTAGRRGAALSLLNASWTAGAVVCPAIAWLWISRWPPAYLFLMLALTAAATVLLIDRNQRFSSPGGGTPPDAESSKGRQRIIAVFTMLALLYVGVESAVGGWMTSYVHRLQALSYAWPPLAASGFWAALLGGRVLAPVVLRWISEDRLLASSLLAAFVSTVLLLLSPSALPIVIFTALAGLALGPVFPLLLARVLSLTANSPNAKWVFGISGVGAALFPWMTGQVSALSGSLRTGLAVPVFGMVAMIALFAMELRGRRCAGSSFVLVTRRVPLNR